MATRVVPVGVLLCLLLRSLLSAVNRVHGFFLVEVIMLKLVEMLLGLGSSRHYLSVGVALHNTWNSGIIQRNIS